MILGLVGGIGSGKSTVAASFAALGCPVVDADSVGHRVLETEPIRLRVAERFGADVLGEGGQVDRRRLGEVVFADPGALKDLNDMTHPAIRAEILARMRAHESSSPAGANGVLVLDVPLLASAAELREACDGVVFVDASREVRLERCRERGWDAQEMDRREAFQAPLAEKRALARWTIENSGPIEATSRQVKAVLDEILAAEP